HRVVTVRWVAESSRALRIVQDRGYRWLQKEGCPNQYVPSKETVARDVKKLYAAAKERLSKDLQEYEYLLPIQLDCWTSPNHRAFMSIVTNILRKSELDGSEELTEILLAFVELPRSH
ncbi:hypothetical protein EV360DRAFT_26039, partial [Lentinula raphanica]